MRTIIVLAAIIMLAIKVSGQCLNFTLTIVPPSCIGCCDGYATVENLTGGCPPYMYIWSSGITGPSIPEICFDTTWTLTIIDSDTTGLCCPDTTMECRISSSTGFINTKSKESTISIFPNPASQTLNLKYNDSDYKILTVIIYDSKGLIIINKKISENIDISSITPGEYVIVLKNDNDEIYRSKWIKN